MGFGAHDPKHGARLGKQIASGATGLARRFVTEEEGAGVKEKAMEVFDAGLAERREREAGNDNRPRGKRGPAPMAGPRPWDVEGISRRTWFRRRKGGGG